ncbi:MAG: hypothetical protein ABI132_03895 [Rhodanobacteraceae bacterium]
MRILTGVLYVLGAAMLIGAGIAAFSHTFILLVPQLLIGGLLLIVGVAFERWRYKTVTRTRPDPRWIDTGERFVDPETGLLTTVYLDPANGERYYIAAPDVTEKSAHKS